MFRPTYLYIKTHNITGLKYFGKTVQDPFKYKGSGTRWLNHIKKHGYDVTTEILLETDDKKELIKQGLYYSKLWEVDKNDHWANLIMEIGPGRSGPPSDEIRQKISKANTGKIRTEEHRKNISNARKGQPSWNKGLKYHISKN